MNTIDAQLDKIVYFMLKSKTSNKDSIWFWLIDYENN